MLPLDRPLLDEITLAAAGVALIALILGLFALIQLRRLRKSFRTLDGPDGGRETVLQALGRVQGETARLRTDVGRARDEVASARAALADALRHVAVVRYDAFGDMGGRMSFTAALLDDAADGLVITAINGRTEGRSYAKGVKGGRGELPLSPEEEQAIRLALGSAPGATGAPGAVAATGGGRDTSPADAPAVPADQG